MIATIAAYTMCGGLILAFVHLLVSQVWEWRFNQQVACGYAGASMVGALWLLYTL